MKGLSSALEELQHILYEAMQGTLKQFVEWGRQATVAIQNFAKANPALVATLIKMAGALGIILTTVGTAAVAVGGLMSLWGVIAPALTAISSAAWPIVAAIAAIGSVLMYAYTHWDELMAYMEPGLGRLRAGIDALSEAWSAMSPIVMPLLGGIAELIGTVVVAHLKILWTIWTTVFNEMAFLAKVVAEALANVANFISWIVQGLSGFAGSIGGIMSGLGAVAGATSNVTINNDVSVNSAQEAADYTNNSGVEFYAMD